MISRYAAVAGLAFLATFIGLWFLPGASIYGRAGWIAIILLLIGSLTVLTRSLFISDAT
jgi:hypothetical protein